MPKQKEPVVPEPVFLVTMEGGLCSGVLSNLPEIGKILEDIGAADIFTDAPEYYDRVGKVTSQLFALAEHFKKMGGNGRFIVDDFHHTIDWDQTKDGDYEPIVLPDNVLALLNDEARAEIAKWNAECQADADASAAEDAMHATNGDITRVAIKFECEKCGTDAETSVSGMVDGGTPVCEKCDEEMTLADDQPGDALLK